MTAEGEMQADGAGEEAGGPEGEAAELYEPNASLAELKEKMAKGRPDGELPKRLPLGHVKVAPGLFQPRGISEKHIGDLVRALNSKGAWEDLERVLVMPVGHEAYLIEGHHRLAAYERAGREVIPVRYFTGSLEEALLRAGRENSRAKLPMTPSERQEFAWRLVRMALACHSKRDIAEAAGVSPRQVATMRKVRRELGDAAYDARTWRGTWSRYKGLVGDAGDWDRDAWLEEQVNEWADRMAKTFGTKLSNNIELAARTLEAYFGRRMPDLAKELAHHIPEDEENEFDFC
ncbi:MAG: ParB N-terminal domain-containing protein [Rhodomicrobium sp.]